MPWVITNPLPLLTPQRMLANPLMHLLPLLMHKIMTGAREDYKPLVELIQMAHLTTHSSSASTTGKRLGKLNQVLRTQYLQLLTEEGRKPSLNGPKLISNS
jgi:hypothetical protein